MRSAFFIFLLLFGAGAATCAQFDECRSYINEEVVLTSGQAMTRPDDTSAPGTNTPGLVIRAGVSAFTLVPVNNSFEIVSFIVTGENSEGDILTANCTYFNPMALMIYRQARPGSDIFITCIKARHTNGKVYTLKPLTIRR